MCRLLVDSIYLSREVTEINEALESTALSTNPVRKWLADPDDTELEELMSEEASEKHVNSIDK